ncbi:MAG TPA: hypothetical protein VML75_09970 [Kofleriaceae bacterium]|nr:hypothetical protein [Kofleriaceae bacterium]
MSVRGPGGWWDLIRGRARRAVHDVGPALRAHRPAAIAVALAVPCVVLTALAFPETTAGGVAAALLIAVAGAGFAWMASQPTAARIPAWVWSIAGVLIVVSLARVMFGDEWNDGVELARRDWGTHHALVRDLIDGLDRGGVPSWLHGVSTGDPAYELYPVFTYYLAAKAAVLFDYRDDLPLLLLRMTICVHVAFALLAARLARRVVPWPLAMVVGLVLLYDRGGAGGGGTKSLLYYGLLHSTVAQCLWLLALTAVIDGLRRPRLATSVQVWILAALGAVAHPIGVATAGIVVMALLAVALLARDLPARRSVAMAFHVALGAAVAAMVWMPLMKRLTLYAVHYGTSLPSLDEMTKSLLNGTLPHTSFPALVAVGSLGVLVALFSRRAVPTLLAMISALILAAISDELYTFFQVGASPEVARFSATRLLSALRVPLLICGAYVVHLGASRVRREWGGRSVLVAGAVAALLVAFSVRGLLPVRDELGRAIDADMQDSVPDPDGMREVTAWARDQMPSIRPDAYARLMHQGPSNFLYHVHANTGIPTLWVGAVSDLMLRERIENMSPDSLHRFNIRWVVRAGSPPTLGDPNTERRFGNWFVRDLPSWDGRFARVERGAGDALVTRLDDDQVDVELRGTTEPALVVLGTGYYPRWRARAADGREVPVYAYPAVPGGPLRVVAAWLPPGRTSFRPDGPLPSDGRGLPLSVLAIAIIVAIEMIWSVRRWRLWMLRRMARGRRRLAGPARLLGWGALGAGAIALVVFGAIGSTKAARSLQLGHGLVGDAVVQARKPGEAWQDCGYSAVRGAYRCDDLLFVEDGLAALLNDAPPSWAFVTPSIRVVAEDPPVEFRIKHAVRLGGSYQAASRDGPVELDIDGEHKVVGGQTSIDLGRTRDRTVTLEGTARNKALVLTMVRWDSIDPKRRYPGVPERPPPSVSAAAPR